VARNNAIIAGYNATEAEQAGETQAYVTSQTAAAQGRRIKAAQAANNIDVIFDRPGPGGATQGGGARRHRDSKHHGQRRAPHSAQNRWSDTFSAPHPEQRITSGSASVRAELVRSY
jgi:hypothetical protein